MKNLKYIIWHNKYYPTDFHINIDIDDYIDRKLWRIVLQLTRENISLPVS